MVRREEVAAAECKLPGRVAGMGSCMGELHLPTSRLGVVLADTGTAACRVAERSRALVGLEATPQNLLVEREHGTALVGGAAWESPMDLIPTPAVVAAARAVGRAVVGT